MGHSPADEPEAPLDAAGELTSVTKMLDGQWRWISSPESPDAAHWLWHLSDDGVKTFCGDHLGGWERVELSLVIVAADKIGDRCSRCKAVAAYLLGLTAGEIGR